MQSICVLEVVRCNINNFLKKKSRHAAIITNIFNISLFDTFKLYEYATFTRKDVTKKIVMYTVQLC